MEKEVIVSRRFRNNLLHVYEYLLKEHSAKIAFRFLEKLEQRTKLIIAHPLLVNPRKRRKISAVFHLLRITRYFTVAVRIRLKFFACLICGRMIERSVIEFIYA